jgi:hypothetical protein
VSDREGRSQSSATRTITDGTSNTIIIGENTEPPAQDHQAGTPVTGRDGRGGNISEGNQGQQTTTPPITDGTSNTIIIGGNTAPPAQDQPAGTPVTGRDGRGENIVEDNEGQHATTPTITDETSNTIIIGEQTEPVTESSAQPATEDQQGQETESTSSTTNITDGTSNTILIGEEENTN